MIPIARGRIEGVRALSSPRVYKKVIRGRLVVARPRRGFCEVLVYAGETPDTELVGDWEMPREMNSVLYLAAQQAELQTPRNYEGDSA
jgi:hypothetical protein